MNKISLLLVLLLVAPAFSADMPATTEAVVKGLPKFGYKYTGLEGNTLVYRARGTGARVKIGPNKKIMEGGVVFTPEADATMVAGALALFYHSLQMDMGKARYKEPSDVIALKMRRLLDTIKHNLKIKNSTQFEFDDLQVVGMEFKAEKAALIVFRPYPR